MILKLICWLFGHKRTANGFDNSTMYDLIKKNICPRCGKKLTEK